MSSKDSDPKEDSKAKKKVDKVISEAKEAAKEIQEEAKSVASDFTKGAKEAYEELTSKEENKRILAGVLAIFFGALGIHKFVLGYYKEGLIMLVVSLLSFGFLATLMALIGLIEGIIYLTKSDAEFYITYQLNRRPWF